MSCLGAKGALELLGSRVQAVSNNGGNWCRRSCCGVRISFTTAVHPRNRIISRLVIRKMGPRADGDSNVCYIVTPTIPCLVPGSTTACHNTSISAQFIAY